MHPYTVKTKYLALYNALNVFCAYYTNSQMEVNMPMKETIQSLGVLIFINLVGCANQMHVDYLLELNGNPNTRCEILNDQKLIGSFTVPSSVNLGSKVGKLEANCTLNNKPIASRIQVASPQCQNQIIVKGRCSAPTVTVETVEIIVKQSM